MTRVNNALICPNDDVIYAGSECPVCMSRLGHPIRNWICPMNPVVGGQRHEPTVYPSVHKEQPQSDFAGMTKGRIKMQILQYEKVEKRLLTPCPYNQDPSPVEGFPGVAKIGSAACEKYCRFFISHDHEKCIVKCNYIVMTRTGMTKEESR